MRFQALGRLGWLLPFVAVSLLGCGKATPPAAPPPEPPKEREFTIGVGLARIDEPRWAQLKADIETAAGKHRNFRLILRVADNNVDNQKKQFDEFRNSNVNLIIVRPVEALAITLPVAQAVESKVPVIVLDRAVVGDKFTCFISADRKEIGTAAGKWLAERLHGKGNLVEIKGPVDSLVDQELHSAFRAAMREPGYRFVYEGHLDPPRVDAATLISEALGRVEKIDAVFACDDTAALAAHETMKAAGRGKNTLFVGVGGLPSQGVAYVANGDLSATVLLPTGGDEAIDAAVQLLDGKKVPKNIVLPTRVIVGKATR
jgi:ribose transport system substrate-binding protein